YYSLYENGSVSEIQSNGFEDNKKRKNSDYEDSDDDELKLKVEMIFET
ncbi:20427_t:CDS:1, partial [Cetraspora pellucida]